jgi:hypothetical protein
MVWKGGKEAKKMERKRGRKRLDRKSMRKRHEKEERE